MVNKNRIGIILDILSLASENDRLNKDDLSGLTVSDPEIIDRYLEMLDESGLLEPFDGNSEDEVGYTATAKAEKLIDILELPGEQA